MTNSEIISAVTLIGVAAAVLYTTFKREDKGVSAEVISNYEKLDQQQKDQIAKYEHDHGALKTQMENMEKGLIAKIAKLEGQLQEKNRQLDQQNRLLEEKNAIIANRNPELETVLGEIRDFMKQLNETNKLQTAMLKKGQTRDDKIDESTKAEVGHVLRKT